MPYIKLEERSKFLSSINEIMGILRDGTDTIYIKGEYFGYFVNRFVKKWLGDQSFTQHSFNSFFFNESKKKALNNASDHLAAAIMKGDPLATAGEIHYCISTILWGLLGKAEGFGEAHYGFRTYLRAMIEKVLQSVETVNTGSQRDMAMAFRRHLIIRGVLGDVVSETYRRVTAENLDRMLSPDHPTEEWVKGRFDLWTDKGTIVVGKDDVCKARAKALEAAK
jgi:hypothetical protein